MILTLRDVEHDIPIVVDVPEGDHIDSTHTGINTWLLENAVRWRQQGTDWVVDAMLEMHWKKGYPVIFDYDKSDLNGNYIEYNSDAQLRGTDEGVSPNNNYGALVEIEGTGCIMRIAMWTQENELHSSLDNLSNTGWFRPNSPSPEYPQATGPTARAGSPYSWGSMAPDYNHRYLPGAGTPKVSFNFETYSYQNTTYPIFVITGWYGAEETIGGEVVVTYRPRWQRLISATLALGSKYLTPKTNASTPNTTPKGGTGARDNTSQNVPIPAAADLADLNYYAAAGDSGMHLYQITQQNWNTLQKKFYNVKIIDKIGQRLKYMTFTSFSTLTNFVISATKIGLPLTELSTQGTPTYVRLGPITFDNVSDGTVQAKALNSRFGETDEYTFSIPYYSRTFLDFSPYTKIQVHIPYCGIVDVSPDACVGGEIKVKYIIDMVTASCTAIVQTKDQFKNKKITAILSGQCGVSVPMLSSDVNMSKLTDGIRAVATGAIGAITGNAPLMVTSTVDFTNTLKEPTATPKVLDSSSAGGVSAVMGDRSLYVTIFHPQDITAYTEGSTTGVQIDGLGDKVGYPAAFAAKIDEIGLSAGGTECYIEAIVNPNTIQTATDAEKEAIRTLIQRGVYI